MKTPENTVDIIIPYYKKENSDELFKLTFGSILMQTFSSKINVIIIGCNGNSADNIAPFNSNFLELYKNLYFRSSGKIISSNEAKNLGLSYSTSPYIMFMEIGDTFTNSYIIERMYNYLSSNKKCGVLSGNVEEEILLGHFATHTQSISYVYGKLYKRTFIKKYNASFLSVSENGNEFNGILNFSAKKDEIMFLNETVYVQKFDNERYEKNNSIDYLYKEKFINYICNELFIYKISNFNIEHNKTKKTSKELNEYILANLVFLYYYYINAIKNDKNNDEFMNALRNYSNEVVKDYISKYGNLNYSNISDIFSTVIESALDVFDNSVEPIISFASFLSLIQ